MKKAAVLSYPLLLILILTACSLLPQTDVADLPSSTTVYETIAAGLTETVQPTDSPAMQTITSLPSSTHSPVPSPKATTSPGPTGAGDALDTPTPTVHVIPCNLAAPGRPYVDITVPDGTRFKPGEGFSKTWRLVNAGSCKWTGDYAIAWFSGEVFGAVTEQKFGSDILPGQSIDITVDMISPRQAGVHQSNWKLRNASGTLFGIGPNGDAPFWVRIEVEAISTATNSPQPTPAHTPTPGSLAKGALQLIVGTRVDLDTGKENTGTGDDLELQEKDGSPMMLALLNNTTLAEMKEQAPVLSDCQTVGLKNQPIPVESLKEGSTFCYRSNQGLPGFFRIKILDLGEKKLTIEYLTWAIP